MKRVKNLFPILISDDNIKQAIRDVNKSHRRTRRGLNRTVIWIESTLEERVRELRNIVIKGFKPSRPKVTRRYDHNAKKIRTITEPKLWPDQYIHHMLVQALMPVMMRGMDYWCCGSIKGRGLKRGQTGIRKWLKNDQKHTKYCAELDIHHFYESILPSIIESRFRSLINDERVMKLIKVSIQDGVMIGAFHSQWFANVLLQPLDHYIREVLHVPHYLRYMDNLTLFHSNKRVLHKAVRAISDYLNSICLRLKPNWQVYKVSSRPVSALGYRYQGTRFMLRKPVLLRLKRKYRSLHFRLHNNLVLTSKMASGMLSRLSLLTITTTRELKNRYLKLKFIRLLKAIIKGGISYEDFKGHH